MAWLQYMTWLTILPSSIGARLASSLTVILWCWSQASAEDWPQFRGPNCSGISTSNIRCPRHFPRAKMSAGQQSSAMELAAPSSPPAAYLSSAMTADETVSLFAFEVPPAESYGGATGRPGRSPKSTRRTVTPARLPLPIPSESISTSARWG